MISMSDIVVSKEKQVFVENDQFKIILHNQSKEHGLYLCEVLKNSLLPQYQQDKRWVVLQHDKDSKKYHSAMPYNCKNKKILSDLTVEGILGVAKVKLMRKMEASSFFKELDRQAIR